MKKILILTGGDAPLALDMDFSEYYIIAADSGLELAERYNVRVDEYVGDNDSLERKDLLADLPKKYFFEQNKDLTDTEIALEHAQHINPQDISIVGGGGGREDHFLAILSLFERELHPHYWYTANSYFEYIDDVCTISGAEGRVVSFFPLGNTPCIAKSSGLQWNLDKSTLHKGLFSVSNSIVGILCKVQIQQGKLLMVLN